MKIVVLAWLLLVPSLAALRGCLHQRPPDPSHDSLRHVAQPERSRTIRRAARLQD
jgi:hypothetical protein